MVLRSTQHKITKNPHPISSRSNQQIRAPLLKALMSSCPISPVINPPTSHGGDTRHLCSYLGSQASPVALLLCNIKKNVQVLGDDIMAALTVEAHVVQNASTR